MNNFTGPIKKPNILIGIHSLTHRPYTTHNPNCNIIGVNVSDQTRASIKSRNIYLSVDLLSQKMLIEIYLESLSRGLYGHRSRSYSKSYDIDKVPIKYKTVVDYLITEYKKHDWPGAPFADVD